MKDKRLRQLLKQINEAAIFVAKNKAEFDDLIEEKYGFHYSDQNLDEIIECLDYGATRMSFQEFNKAMMDEKKRMKDDKARKQRLRKGGKK